MIKILAVIMLIITLSLVFLFNQGNSLIESNRLEFNCDKQKFEVVFYHEQDYALLLKGGDSYKLNRVKVASGIRYANSEYDLTGKGHEMVLNILGSNPKQCDISLSV